MAGHMALAAVALTACAPGARQMPRPTALSAGLYAFADDSMLGREAGQAGGARAAVYIAAEARRIGLEPAGHGGSYFQDVPLAELLPSPERPIVVPARNVIAVLRGSDPALRAQYVAVGAHSDHRGIRPVVEHDSIRAFNTVMRPDGAQTPRRPPTEAEWQAVRHVLDSLRRQRPRRPDSIANGAHDDGSGVIGTLAIAEALAAESRRPRRSILFVWHTAEELGLLGSQWFTDHPTVPRDSIIAQVNVDMIGTGQRRERRIKLATIGSRRLSRSLGDLIDSVGAKYRERVVLDYSYDAVGHPLRRYCRSDHYSYARYGIPIVFFSTGYGVHYHQVTDEPQYIDYSLFSEVVEVLTDVVRAAANRRERFLLDHRTPAPEVQCQ